MAKYEAVVKNFGFQGRYWRVGDIATVAKGGEIPNSQWFKPVKATAKDKKGQTTAEA